MIGFFQFSFQYFIILKWQYSHPISHLLFHGYVFWFTEERGTIVSLLLLLSACHVTAIVSHSCFSKQSLLLPLSLLPLLLLLLLFIFFSLASSFIQIAAELFDAVLPLTVRIHSTTSTNLMVDVIMAGCSSCFRISPDHSRPLSISRSWGYRMRNFFLSASP